MAEVRLGAALEPRDEGRLAALALAGHVDALLPPASQQEQRCSARFSQTNDLHPICSLRVAEASSARADRHASTFWRNASSPHDHVRSQPRRTESGITHFLLSSRPAAFSKWEQVMMQPPCMTSIIGRLANSLEVHLMYRSRSWPPRKKPVSLQQAWMQVRPPGNQ